MATYNVPGWHEGAKALLFTRPDALQTISFSEGPVDINILQDLETVLLRGKRRQHETCRLVVAQPQSVVGLHNLLNFARSFVNRRAL